MVNQRIIVIPYSAVEGDGAATESAASSLDTLLAGMDTGTGTDTSGQATPPADTDATAGANTGAATDGANTDSTPPAGETDSATKTNFAFGQMRKQISDMQAILGKVAGAAGIEYKDPNELLAKLNEDAITKLAQKQNVPVELLKEVEALRADSDAYKMQQFQAAASIGFQNVMTQFGINESELKAFALELDQKGINPFTDKVDLVNEYQSLHFNDIVNKRIEAAVQEALKKSGAADQSSSNPGSIQGAGGGNSEQKVTTVAGLNAILDSVKLN